MFLAEKFEVTSFIFQLENIKSRHEDIIKEKNALEKRVCELTALSGKNSGEIKGLEEVIKNLRSEISQQKILISQMEEKEVVILFALISFA